MPAIDIAQVRGEAAELARLYPELEPFVAASKEFFEAHGSPLYRQSDAVSVRAPLKSFGTPPAVLRTLLGALRKTAAADAEYTVTVAERLWAEPAREQRYLAAGLLGVAAPACPDRAGKLMAQWLLGLDNIDVAEALAENVAGPWLAADLWHRIEEARFWLNSANKYQRQCGLAALAVVVKARSFADVPLVLGVLKGLMREQDLETRKRVAHLLRDLSERGQGAVAAWLREWADTIDKNTNWIVRQAMTKLDDDTRREIMAVLRGRSPH